MAQTQRQSHFEATVNIVVSLAISVPANALLIVLTEGMHLAPRSVLMTGVFVLLSYIRQYLLRRYLNWRHG